VRETVLALILSKQARREDKNVLIFLTGKAMRYHRDMSKSGLAACRLRNERNTAFYYLINND